MIISYQWLLDYLPLPLPVEELSKILTSIGLEVEAIELSERIRGSLRGLVIGEVVACGPHPGADKLKITKVDTGGELLYIVCGAPNVAAGQKVIVAPVGTMVHPLEGEPFLIKKAKIRGEVSEGMICAEDEIGLGTSHDGIIVLPDDAKPGTPASAYYNIAAPDHAIHIGLTPNRSDAMSHIGVARDVCAYLTCHKGERYDVRLPAIPPVDADEPGLIKINIYDAEACPRYMGLSMSDITVCPSPEWLVQRLNTIGIRPINNVVDVTNYVLHEYGQPLHAFDADKIQGATINVRFLPQGSKFTTLDGKERTLEGNDLMICDTQQPLAIAGVFGGLNSGVSQTTNTLFIESAYFSPAHIRRTSLHHGLRTDAATHFEKGVDINNLFPALSRAALLISQLAGGKIASSISDIYPIPRSPVKVEASYKYIHDLSGKQYEPQTIKDTLQALDFLIEAETPEGITLSVPSNKTDIAQPADIVEEILRIDGLDNIQIPERLNISLNKGLPDDRQQRETIAGLLCGTGFQEIVTNSIVNGKYYPDRTDLVRMLNSLSNELDVMRPSMLESGLEVIQYNCNRKNKDLRLFELGRVYSVIDAKYKEETHLGLWITGDLNTAHWDQSAVRSNLFYLKGVINNLLICSGIKNPKTAYNETGNTGEVNWTWKNRILCTIKQVEQKKLADFDIKQDVFYADINWDIWMAAWGTVSQKYVEVPKFPAVQRDLSIVITKETTYGQVQEVTEQLKIDGLRSFDLFDVFESDKLGANKKAYALSYTFQVQDRTLTDNETEHIMQQLMNAYKNKLNAEIRQ